MNFTLSHQRQTGRTTRMIIEALKLQQEGRAVYILCSGNDTSFVKSLFYKVCNENKISPPSSIKFETLKTLGEKNINWKNSKIIGAHDNCELLIDHNVWAEHFSWAINGFHQYDEEK